jgi:hypothetical protein
MPSGSPTNVCGAKREVRNELLAAAPLTIADEIANCNSELTAGEH